MSDMLVRAYIEAIERAEAASKRRGTNLTVSDDGVVKVGVDSNYRIVISVQANHQKLYDDLSAFASGRSRTGRIAQSTPKHSNWTIGYLPKK